MNKYLSNKFNAYMGVKGVLQMNSDIFEVSEIVSSAVTEFYEILDEIKEVAARAGSDTTGETSAKKVAKERLAYVAKFTGCLRGSVCCE